MDTALNNPKKRGKIRVMDTTLRDGEQTQNVSFSPEEKLAIAKTLLEKVKADAIEVSSARTSPGEAKAVKKITAWASQKRLLDKVEVLGFVDGKKSVDWIGKCGAVRMNLLAKGSLVHLEKQLGKSPGEHFEEIRKTVEYAAGQGIKTSVFLEDWSNGAKESRQYTERLIGELAKMQVERIYLTDTLGILTPRETQKLVSETVKSFPEKTFEFHAHNDYGLATANSLAAINAGCLGLHTTVNGLGERAGNAPP